ncbi:flavin reductase family protein [Burkholderia ambifaria]|uniref:flavin reductase family protein n=1 Tax=Burkholderia ambifaria TaxID=152480 RepID=UPI0033954477
MSRIGAAVNIITTTTPSGDVGMTVSAVCSVTDDPATVLVCIGRSSRQYLATSARRASSVSTSFPMSTRCLHRSSRARAMSR